MQANVKRDEIMHIGDNHIADYIGATSFGFKALLIENHEYSIELIKRKIDEKNSVL
jgi:FMN phosphatase YigB (HAD superfamily)